MLTDIVTVPNYGIHIPDALDDTDDFFLAGGAVLASLTNGEINDYDIYPKSKESAKHIVETLFGNSELINVSTKAITFLPYETNMEGKRTPIQVMAFNEFSTASKIFENFDFTVCMVAVDDKGTLHYDQQGMLDIAKRKITFNPKTLFPLASLVRLNKYQRKGFHVSNATTTAVGFAASAKGMPSTWDEAANLIGGVYGKQLSVKKDNNVPFTLEALIDSLNEGVVNYAANAPTITLDALLYSIDPKPIPHTYILGRGIEVKDGNILGKELSFDVFAKGEQITKPLLKSYKYVIQQPNGTLVSQHNTAFQYQLGQVAEHKKAPWLFSSKVIESYKKYNGVLIEVYTLPDYVKKYEYGPSHAILQSEKLYVNRIVPQDEVAKIRNKEMVALEDIQPHTLHIYNALVTNADPVPVFPTPPEPYKADFGWVPTAPNGYARF